MKRAFWIVGLALTLAAQACGGLETSGTGGGGMGGEGPVCQYEDGGPIVPCLACPTLLTAWVCSEACGTPAAQFARTPQYDAVCQKDFSPADAGPGFYGPVMVGEVSVWCVC